MVFLLLEPGKGMIKVIRPVNQVKAKMSKFRAIENVEKAKGKKEIRYAIGFSSAEENIFLSESKKQLQW